MGFSNDDLQDARLVVVISERWNQHSLSLSCVSGVKKSTFVGHSQLVIVAEG